MNIRGVSLDDFYAVTNDVSRRAYEGNVIVAPEARWSRRSSFNARLRVVNSRGPGARTAASGRHGPYACWHAYRDVLWQMFVANPDATARTALATYRGQSGFERDYPATRYRVVGSVAYPVSMAALCVAEGCGAEGPPFLRVPDECDPRPLAAEGSDDVLARIERELRQAEIAPPEPMVFEGPVSLLDAPDLAYSGR
ncbi:MULTISPECIES: hypothetical protein [unclassified Streptomyces]|uniref:Uncharacterized protein n=1 Tax=Streptomyces millisiae TaxID=3075542 RepID=A0ABU2LLQ0_9ACTN|nr:hypothetical protein [Streptomyces sp. DSM 44918]MDT0318514.1 hypothetical protein [Streptomyces sp. DSM 44918]